VKTDTNISSVTEDDLANPEVTKVANGNSFINPTKAATPFQSHKSSFELLGYNVITATPEIQRTKLPLIGVFEMRNFLDDATQQLQFLVNSAIEKL
jgi:hypothetical protein